MTTKSLSLAEQAKLHNIIIAPHISEKSANTAERFRQYVFKVLIEANKVDIKNAVELFFNVEVTKVRTLIVKGKKKMFRGTVGKRSDWKKAYVTLKEGQQINFAGNE